MKNKLIIMLTCAIVACGALGCSKTKEAYTSEEVALLYTENLNNVKNYHVESNMKMEVIMDLNESKITLPLNVHVAIDTNRDGQRYVVTTTETELLGSTESKVVKQYITAGNNPTVYESVNDSPWVRLQSQFDSNMSPDTHNYGLPELELADGEFVSGKQRYQIKSAMEFSGLNIADLVSELLDIEVTDESILDDNISTYIFTKDKCNIESIRTEDIKFKGDDGTEVTVSSITKFTDFNKVKESVYTVPEDIMTNAKSNVANFLDASDIEKPKFTTLLNGSKDLFAVTLP